MRVRVYHNIARDDHDRMISLDGYQPGQPLVHVLTADLGPGALAGAAAVSAENLAEDVFTACNLNAGHLTGRLRTIATAYRHHGLRSQSAGDVTALDDGASCVVMSVERCGFSPVTGSLNVVTAWQHGTVPWAASSRPAPVWMLHRWDRHDDETTPHPAREHALAQLAGHARSSWATIAGQPDIPASPPDADQEAVDLYYGPDGSEGGPCGDEEGYSLHLVELDSPTPAVPPRIIAAHPGLAIDLASADGRAVYRLFGQIKDLEERAGEWPGAEVVDLLASWLASCGFDLDAPAPDLP